MTPTVSLWLLAAFVVVLASAATGVTSRAEAAALKPRLAFDVGEARGGEVALAVSARTRNGARCSLSVRARSAQVRLPPVNSAGGRVGWRWQIPAGAPKGTWRFAARCVRGRASARASRSALLLIPSAEKTTTLIAPGSVEITAGRIAVRLPSQDVAPEDAGKGGGGSNPFPRGWCTWGAWELAQWLGPRMRGNAKQWVDTAPPLGFRVGSTPVVGAVFVKTSGYYGHVGVVTEVLGGGRFRTNEMNGGSLLASPPNEYGKTSEFGRFVAHTRSTGPEMKFIYRPGTEPQPPQPPSPPVQTPAATATPTPTATPAPTASPAPRARAHAYDNFGSASAGHAMCRGNPGTPSSMPGGTATQSFTVPGGVASIDSALVQIDPDARVTAHMTLSINGSVRATATAPASGDTRFNFAEVAVRPGDTAAMSIRFTATFGKIITVYSAAATGGTLTIANSCPDGAPSLTRANGLRAQLTGWNQ